MQQIKKRVGNIHGGINTKYSVSSSQSSPYIYENEIRYKFLRGTEQNIPESRSANDDISDVYVVSK